MIGFLQFMVILVLVILVGSVIPVVATRHFRAVSIGDVWSVDLPAQHDELLAQQGVLNHQLSLASTEVHYGARYCPSGKRITGWPFPNPANDTLPELGGDEQHKKLKKRDQLQCLSKVGMPSEGRHIYSNQRA